MKIKFYPRISGYARIAYIKDEVECQSYTVLNHGDWYDSPLSGRRQCIGYALQINEKGVYELKPGSKVKVVK